MRTILTLSGTTAHATVSEVVDPMDSTHRYVVRVAWADCDVVVSVDLAGQHRAHKLARHLVEALTPPAVIAALANDDDNDVRVVALRPVLTTAPARHLTLVPPPTP